jgi:hypothetical protein
MSHDPNPATVLPSAAAPEADGHRGFRPQVLYPMASPPLSSSAAVLSAADETAARSRSDAAPVATRTPRLSLKPPSSFSGASDDGSVGSVSPFTPTPRAPSEDWRTALHESGHLITGLLVGRADGKVTIEPSEAFGGLTWWSDEQSPQSIDLLEGEKEVLAQCLDVHSVLPLPGASRECLTPLAAAIHEQLIVDLAGKAAEALFFTYGPALEPASDLRKARARAGQLCSSDAANDAMLAWAFEEAKARLYQHRGAVLAIAEALVKRRTLTDPAEITELVAKGEARQSLAEDQERRAAMRRVAESAAASFAQFQRIR